GRLGAPALVALAAVDHALGDAQFCAVDESPARIKVSQRRVSIVAQHNPAALEPPQQLREPRVVFLLEVVDVPGALGDIGRVYITGSASGVVQPFEDLEGVAPEDLHAEQPAVPVWNALGHRHPPGCAVASSSRVSDSEGSGVMQRRAADAVKTHP